MNDLILELEERLRLAMLDADIEVLDSLISDDLKFRIPDGALINKASDLEAYKSGTQRITELECVELFIQEHELFCVSFSKMNLKGEYSGQSIDGAYCYTRVWKKVGNSFKVVAGDVSYIS